MMIETISQLALLKETLKNNGVMRYRSGFKNFKNEVCFLQNITKLINFVLYIYS